jgi:predicted SprT family Zn-dependent metalloprotease
VTRKIKCDKIKKLALLRLSNDKTQEVKPIPESISSHQKAISEKDFLYITCPCGKMVFVPKKYVGRKMRCNKCNAVFLI